MELVKNFRRLYGDEIWSLVIFFIPCFSLGNTDPRNCVSADAVNHPTTSHGINKIPINFTKALVIGTGCQLTAFNINDIKNYVELNLTKIHTETCTFDFDVNNTIYHTFTHGTIMSFPKSDLKWQTAALHNSMSKLRDIFDIAVDSINNKLYVITLKNEIESDKLMVIDLVTGYSAIVITDLNLPKHIEVDPSSGLLFIQQQSSILRANMDGTSKVNILEKKGISRMTIDRVSKRIFWATSQTIESSSYNNENHRIHAKIARPVRDLAVLGVEMFWLSTPSGMMQPDTRASRCKMNHYTTCDKESIKTIPFENPQTIKAYDFNELHNTANKKKNRCNDMHPSCEHMCLLKKDGYSCACKLGYKLNSDRHTCQLAYDKFLLYVQDNYAKGRIVGSETNNSYNFVDAIYPNVLESQDSFVSFDYDYQDNTIYFTENTPGNNQLYVKKLDTNKKQISIHSYDHVEVFSTAFDWVSKNVYQLVCDNRKGHMRIIVHHFPEINNDENTIIRYSKDLIELPRSYEAGSIVVHPLRGFIFITARKDFESEWHIYRVNLDGSNSIDYLVGTSLYGLAIDFEEDSMYHFNALKTELVEYDLKANIDTAKINVTAVQDPTGISIDGNFVYVNNLTTIWRFDKKTGGHPVKMVESADINQPKTIIGTKIYAESAQPVSSEHPCAINNGGCQKFCYSLPSGDERFEFEKPTLRRQCGCEGKEVLRLDGLSCGAALPQKIFT